MSVPAATDSSVSSVVTGTEFQEVLPVESELTEEEMNRAENIFGTNRLINANPRVQPLPTHLWLADNMKYSNWLAVGKNILEVRKSTHFWMGDWLVYGADRYGEKYSQGVEVIGLDPKTLVQYVYVSNAYAIEERNPKLTWRHHQSIAGMQDHEARSEMLRHAAENNMSTRELSQFYRAYRREMGDESVPIERQYACPGCGEIIMQSQLNEILVAGRTTGEESHNE